MASAASVARTAGTPKSSVWLFAVDTAARCESSPWGARMLGAPLYKERLSKAPSSVTGEE